MSNAAVDTATASPADAVDAAGVDELPALLAQLRAELRRLSDRVAQLEQQRAAAPPAAAAAPLAAAPAARPAAPVTEDDMVAIAAAVAAFLGVKAQIRQVRLIQSVAWAQVGRATIHASHRI